MASSKSVRVTVTFKPLLSQKPGTLMLVCSLSDRRCLALSTAHSRLCMSPALARLQQAQRMLMLLCRRRMTKL